MSRFEANVFAQPELIARALRAPLPAWMKPPRGRKIFFVGVGTNHHAARIAAWLWSGAGLDARAVHSYDFVSRPYKLSKGDLGIFLSHRGGTKSYTVKAEEMARRAGASTVAVCGAGAVWKGPKRRLETCDLENTGAFTKSFTTTMVWLLRWAGKPALLAPFPRAGASLNWGPDSPKVTADTDLVLLGDGLREWVACETALKLLHRRRDPLGRRPPLPRHDRRALPRRGQRGLAGADPVGPALHGRRVPLLGHRPRRPPRERARLQGSPRRAVARRRLPRQKRGRSFRWSSVWSSRASRPLGRIP